MLWVTQSQTLTSYVVAVTSNLPCRQMRLLIQGILFKSMLPSWDLSLTKKVPKAFANSAAIHRVITLVNICTVYTQYGNIKSFRVLIAILSDLTLG